MVTITTTFEKVGRRYTKSFTCVDYDKVRECTEEFSQTLNPFNTGDDGRPKSRGQILAEIQVKASEWTPGPSCGCVKRAEIDQRPEKQSPEVDNASFPDDIVARLKEINEEISTINDELKRRFVGTKFSVDGRLAYVTDCRIHKLDTNIRANVWLAKKTNPKERYDWQYMMLSKVLAER